MDLRQVAIALRKGWWIVALFVLLGTLAGFVANVCATPLYASSVTFFVSTPTDGGASSGASALAADQFATRRITSYLGLLKSDVLAEKISTQPDVDLDVSQIQSQITGDADLNTVLLTAVATDSSPDRSVAIATAIASQFGPIVNKVDPIGPQSVVLRVISGPTKPVAVAPRKTVNLTVGFMIGLALGMGLAVLRQLLDTTVRQAQVLRTLTEAPVLGVIPFDRAAKRSPLIVNNSARSARAEALRQLRTNLQFIDVERPVRVLVVTSSVADEGKSTMSANLAVSFAESNRTVLLIEADLRRPRIAEYLGVERSVGLTNVLADQVPFQEVLQPWGRSGLQVLPSGSIPPNPSELLGGPKMLELLALLKRRFDVIVLDTPPLLPVTDAAVVAAHADGAVLVTRYGRTTRGQVATAVRSLKSVDARLLGSILNMTPTKSSDSYESYGYGHYEDEPSTDRASARDEAPNAREAQPEADSAPQPVIANASWSRRHVRANEPVKADSLSSIQHPRRGPWLKPARRVDS